MLNPASSTLPRRKARMKGAALLYFLSRAALGGAVFTIPALYFLRGQVEPVWVAGSAGLTALLYAGSYFAASGLRCPACGAPILLDDGNEKHPYARRLAFLSHRARIARDILFQDSYHCMYCHANCRLGAGAVTHAKPAAAPEAIFQALHKSPLGLEPILEPPPAATGGGFLFQQPEDVLPESFFAGLTPKGAEPAAITPAPESAENGPEREEDFTFPPFREGPDAIPAPPSLSPPVSAPPVHPPAAAPSMNQAPSRELHPSAATSPFTAAGSLPQSAAPPAFPVPAPSASPAAHSPPWTLPSLPPQVNMDDTAPAAPPAFIAPTPKATPPAFPQIIPAVSAPHATAMPDTIPALEPVSPGPPANVLIREVLQVLQKGQQAMEAAVREILEKLESSAPVTAIPAPPAPVAATFKEPAPPAAAASVRDLPVPSAAALITTPEPPVAAEPATLFPVPAPQRIFPARSPFQAPLPAFASVPEPAPAATSLPPLPLQPAVAAPAPPVFPLPPLIAMHAGPAAVAAPAPAPEAAPAASGPSSFAPPGRETVFITPPVFPAPPAPVPADSPVPALLKPLSFAQAAATPEVTSEPAAPATTPSADSPSPFTGRRKFARPTGTAARQLSSALSEAFESKTPPSPEAPPVSFPPPAVNGNGNGHHSGFAPGSNGSSAPSPFQFLQQRAREPQPPPPFAFEPPPVQPLPFSELSYEDPNGPLTVPAGATEAPAPFTFLQNEGGQFTPVKVSTPVHAPDYAPLEDSRLPWMQPVVP